MSGIRPEGEQLPMQMASLELLDPSESDERPPLLANAKRTLRKRLQSPTKPTTTNNRRVKMKPKKLVRQPPLGASAEEIERLYATATAAKVGALTQSLETIFEEPKTLDDDTVVFIGGRKIRRSLKFPAAAATKEKIRLRRSRIKRFFGNRNFANRKKMTAHAFQTTLQGLEVDEDEANSDEEESKRD